MAKQIEKPFVLQRTDDGEIYARDPVDKYNIVEEGLCIEED
jgi:hypothetical protein